MAKKGENKNPRFWDINRILSAACIQNIPQNPPYPFLRKEVHQDSTHLLQIFGDFMNSQHNALSSNKIIKNTKSIKVTPRKWEGGRRRSDDV